MNKTVSDFSLEKFGLSAELVMYILTALSISTGIVTSYEWVIEQNYFWVIFLSIAIVGTITFSVWYRFRFDNTIPKYRTTKVKYVKFAILATASLLALAQAGAIGIFLAEGLAKFPGLQVGPDFENYKNLGTVFFEVLVPIYCFFVFHQTSKQIKKYNESGLPIFPNLGWS